MSDTTLLTLLTTVEICGKALPAEIPDEAREKLRRFLREHCTDNKCEF